jgi:integrase
MRQLYRLNARKIAGLNTPGRYADGHLLFLQVRPNGRSWVMRYHAPNGKVRELGLGSVLVVSLQEARERRDAAYALLRAGTDPLADKASKRAVASNARTFGDFTDEYLKTALTGFRNEKHKWQWRQTLEKHAKPIWKMFLRDVTTADVYAVLDPIWDGKNETARRLRGRIERVLAAAKAKGQREGENPASWVNLKPLFENRNRPAVTHHPALPYKEAPAFMRELRKLTSTSARALDFLILCASRSGEVRGMRWNEIDLGVAKKWTVPALRMKGKNPKDHEVPLTDQAIAILKSMKRGKPNDLVFPGAKPGEPLSDTALLMCLRGIRPGFTSHGFRSTFTDWVGDETEFPRDLREFALAHKIPNEVEAAYRRGDALEKRRQMMADWASYLAS